MDNSRGLYGGTPPADVKLYSIASVRGLLSSFWRLFHTAVVMDFDHLTPFPFFTMLLPRERKGSDEARYSFRQVLTMLGVATAIRAMLQQKGVKPQPQFFHSQEPYLGW